MADDEDNTYNSQSFYIKSGLGQDQVFRILDYDGATHTATIDGTFTTIPDSTSGYFIRPDLIPVTAATLTANTAATTANFDAIKGAGFDTADNSLVAVTDAIAGVNNCPGDGAIPINQDSSVTDELWVLNGSEGVQDVYIYAYLTSEWEAGATTAEVRGQTKSLVDGSWQDPLMLNEGFDYTIYFFRQGVMQTTEEVTP